MEVNKLFIKQSLKEKEKHVDNTIVPSSAVTYNCHDNVVSGKKLRDIQEKILKIIADYVAATYGPMGSNSMIIRGNDSQTISAGYSKDGLKVLKNIVFDKPIELAIQSEVIDIARYTEHQVGDGTTSATILAYNIFKKLNDVQETHNVAPRKLVKVFKDVVAKISEEIKKNGKPITLDDVYHICMISTNGNTEISEQITSLYKEYGFSVSIDVGISNDTDTKIKKYDGMTVNEGYSDMAYINNKANGTAEIYNPNVYVFADPIDTREMVSYLEKIIYDNIINPLMEGDTDKLVPTVIMSPIITRDASAMIGKLVQVLYDYSNQNIDSQKPPILIVTNLTGTDEDIMKDIATLCKAKLIRKYIDPELQKRDQQNDLAPTMDNIVEWCGKAELVVADADKTKFINPISLVTEGDPTYQTLTQFLESEIKKCTAENADKLEIARLKKRLRCLQSNMIEFLVGGIAVSDRDQIKDLVEDAVKNVASAASSGVGRAANFEGLLASFKFVDILEFSELEKDICKAIFESYCIAAKVLYSTVIRDDEQIADLIARSITDEAPFDVAELLEDEDAGVSKHVLTSIMTDVTILEAIAKLVTNMVTANQCLLQTPTINRY